MYPNVPTLLVKSHEILTYKKNPNAGYMTVHGYMMAYCTTVVLFLFSLANAKLLCKTAKLGKDIQFVVFPPLRGETNYQPERETIFSFACKTGNEVLHDL